VSVAATAEVNADLKAAARIARRYMRMQRQHPLWARVCHRGNLRIALEWVAIIAVTYFLVFFVKDWRLLAVLLPGWFIYSALSLDSIVHCFNHWPLFQAKRLNVLWRGLGIFVFWCPLEVRYNHWQHHQAYDLDDDPQEVLRALARRGAWGRMVGIGRYFATETLKSVWSFLPWHSSPEYIAKLRRTRPAHYWEIVLTRWLCCAWMALLIFLRPWETLLFLLPGTFLLAPLASFVMNLTDHLPAQLDHPFRQATYLEPHGWLQGLASMVNHQTAATHLTHHLFPQVHFAHARRLQRRLLKYYRRYQAPQSLIVNTLLLGNPLALVSVTRKMLQQMTPVPRLSSCRPDLTPVMSSESGPA
jgi:fatty acid desaturase